ncbi:MAG: hypothetical protein J1E28_00830 [Helicobacter sp.]|uniref:hypothetical protein n=1 Tax=Helicobacter sp. TaxID=218 RepID=UPI0025BDB432|nr:hypothetical protein [Helicobacter sp.]MCH5312933.1 hypothetical protein [Helicobacter sp.]
MQEIIWLVNICFTILMVGLFVWDFRTFGDLAHKDFKAIIMSTGVLGTFVGIFIGLIGFDTLALQDSVPLLLNGLKTAFYTSILGMGLAIALSIIQKSKGVKSAQDMNMDYVLTQMSNLDHLRGIIELNNKILALPTAEEMRTINTTTHTLLQDINTSLQATIKQLASGASKELIGALELVIRDFNHNLQNQFGENFKELNNAVGQLLTWQEQYKQTIEHTQELLAQTHKAMNESANAMNSTQATLESVVAQNTSAMEFYAKTLGLIEDMRAKGEMLNAKLQEIATLGAHARQCLDNMDNFFVKATQNMDELEHTASKHIDELKGQIGAYFTHLDSYAEQNMQHLRSFIDQSSSSAKEHIGNILQSHSTGFNSHCNELVQQSKGLFEEIISSANTHIVSLSKLLEQNITQNTQSSEHNAQEFARLREHIAKNHTAIVQSLESSLSYLNSHNEVVMQDMLKDMKSMQEQYLTIANNNIESMLNKEQEMIKARLEGLNELSAKSDAYVNAQYEQMSGFIKKLANEYLKIMQKLTKDSVAIPKDMGVQVVKDFGTLQHNLLSHLGNLNAQIQHNSMQLIELYRNVQNTINENIEGNKSLQEEIKGTFNTLDSQMSASMENFKENYEWFLRRVREIIGSR